MNACKNCHRSGQCQQRRHCHMEPITESSAIGWLIVVITSLIAAARAQKGGECLPIRGNQVTCSRGTGGCGIQHKGGD